MKIKEFIQKYRTYLLIGAGIGFVLSIIWAVFLLRKPEETNSNIQNIQSPFPNQTENITYTLEAEYTTPETSMVYKITKPEEYIAKDFVDNFNKSDETFEETEYSLSWNFDSNNFIYNLDTSIMYILADGGIQTNISSVTTANVEKYIESLISELDVIEMTATKMEDGEIKFTGKYKFAEQDLGSLYIGGNAFSAIFDENGKFYNMQILLIEPNNVREYQEMPLADARTITNTPSYPSFLDIHEYSASFYEQNKIIQASTGVKYINIDDIEVKNVFQTYEYGYIYPAYILSGDGKAEDSQNNEYWVDLDIYMSAINPEYLMETVLEEVVLIDEGIEH